MPETCCCVLESPERARRQLVPFRYLAKVRSRPDPALQPTINAKLSQHQVHPERAASFALGQRKSFDVPWHRGSHGKKSVELKAHEQVPLYTLYTLEAYKTSVLLLSE